MTTRSHTTASIRFRILGTAIIAAALPLAAPSQAHADWGFTKVFEIDDGYPLTGTNISSWGTNPSIHDEAVMFGVNGGGNSGIFRYERGTLTPFADTVMDSFTSVTVSSADPHDPYSAFRASFGSSSGIYTRIANSPNYRVIASTSTPIPSGTGNFTSFGDTSIDQQRVTFLGYGSSGQSGIYVNDVNTFTNPSLVVEEGSALPGTFDPIQSFSGISHNGNTVVFKAAGNASSGVYWRTISGQFIGYGTIADTNTTIPGETVKFTSVDSPSYDGQSTAVRGVASGIMGVYTTEGGPLRLVADRDTPLPDRTGNFTFFFQNSVSIDNGDIAFEAQGDNIFGGVFIERNGVLEKVIADGDVIDGRTVSGASIGSDGLSNGHLAMSVSFIDGGSTFYAAFSEHRWDPAGGVGGNWDDRTNWPLGARPATNVHTYIQPDGPAVIRGPFNPVHMRSLTLGAQSAGIAELRLNPTGQIVMDENLTVEAGGKITGDGALHATTGINNLGEINLGNASITLSGGQFDNRNLLRGHGQIDNRFINRPTGEVRITSGQTIRFTGSSNSNQGDVRLLAGGIADFASPLTNTATGSITGQGTLIADGGLTNSGDIRFAAGPSNIFGQVTNNTAGQIAAAGNATLTFWDDVHSNGQILADATSTITFFGDTTGNGSFPGQGQVVFNAAFSGGNSPGDIAFGGDVQFTSAASLVIELLSDTSGQFDTLDIAGQAILGGTLDLQLLNNFTPDEGDSFEIITAASILGEFNEFDANPLPGGKRWQLLYDSTSVILNVLGPPILGDMDGNGVLDAFDVDDFELALADKQAYVDTHPGLDPDELGDFDDNGQLDAFDVDNFEAALAGGGSIPEPATLVLFTMSLTALTRRKC